MNTSFGGFMSHEEGGEDERAHQDCLQRHRQETSVDDGMLHWNQSPTEDRRLRSKKGGPACALPHFSLFKE